MHRRNYGRAATHVPKRFIRANTTVLAFGAAFGLCGGMRGRHPGQNGVSSVFALVLALMGASGAAGDGAETSAHGETSNLEASSFGSGGPSDARLASLACASPMPPAPPRTRRASRCKPGSSWPYQPGPMATGRNGIAVTAHPIATDAAIAVLREGGNAVDAAVAATFTLAVVEPWSSGIGGGGFMLLHRPIDSETFVLDFREQAPLAAHRDMYIRGGEYVRELSRVGWLAVATPGAVAGLLRAADRWGSLPRERLLEPAIRAAEEGFPVSEHYREAASGRALDILRADPEAAGIFLVPGESPADPPRPPPLGHILRQPDLARTLARIADEGAAGFYEGETADAIARASEAGGGLVSLEDLLAYEPTEREPLVFEFRDLEIHSMPPPSSGGVALAQILGMLEGFDLSREGFDDGRRLHLTAEAMRRAFADRNEHLGDPAFMRVPVSGLFSPDYISRLRQGIDPLQATPSADLTTWSNEKAELAGDQTTHVSVVDAAGNAVSLTHTINYIFGAGVVAPGTGVLMNNEMDDFSAAPGRPNIYGLVQSEVNAIAPRKIPLSSMSPTIVLRKDEDGHHRLLMVLGSPGGPTIISQVAQILINVDVFEMNVAEAVAAPRIHHQWLPDAIIVEEGGFSRESLSGLEVRGHELRRRGGFGNAQVIVVDETGRLSGASDPRIGGRAAAF